MIILIKPIKKIDSMKLFLLFIFFLCSILFSQEFNPWNLDINKRVIHRKDVSHIIMDPRVDHFRVVLFLGDRFPYNYKSRQFGFYIKAINEEEAYQIMNQFDKQLDTGREIYLKLNGSRILEWSFN